jgi:hypothetical protein
MIRFRPLHFRHLSAVGFILWLSWVSVGISTSRLSDWFDFFTALLALFIPIGFCYFGWRVRLLKKPRASSLPAPDLFLIIGIFLWVALLTWVISIHEKIDNATLGQWGDAFGMLNCLFVAGGFYFTIRQIKREEDEALRRLGESANIVRDQKQIAQIGAVQTLLAEDTKMLALVKSLGETFARIKEDLEAPRLDQMPTVSQLNVGSLDIDLRSILHLVPEPLQKGAHVLVISLYDDLNNLIAWLRDHGSHFGVETFQKKRRAVLRGMNRISGVFTMVELALIDRIATSFKFLSDLARP